MTEPSGVPIIPGPTSTPAAAAGSSPASAPPPTRRPKGWVWPVAAAAVVLVVLGVAFAAYSAGAGQPNSAAPSPSAPSPTVKVATVGQYAGIINSQAVDIRETWTKFERDCVLVDKLSLACQLYVLTLDAEAKTLDLTLQTAAKPTAPKFIGVPPEEIRQLVADTAEAARALDAAGPDDGDADVGAVWRAGGDLINVLDRWAPYI